MRQLICFEVHKMLRKPLVWAALIGLIGFIAMMEYSWVVPGYASIQMEEDGRKVVIEGFDAIAMDKDICSLYHGPLTDEKVRSIIETYDIPDSVWDVIGFNDGAYFLVRQGNIIERTDIFVHRYGIETFY